MHSACLFCNRPLGTNEVVEEFPIGRRLAFDRALEDELAELERAWHDADEIGAIADSLLLPAWLDDALQRMR